MIAFEPVVAGPEWFDANVPCTRACPVLTKAGRYVAAIARGDDEAAYMAARLPNPFPSICGRVCAAPCEAACRRRVLDAPIAIRALKRFATQQYGVESQSDRDLWRQTVSTRAARGKRVAVVGAGPAGLSCAHDLAVLGWQPVVFDAADRPGGMMALGIPAYRLRRDILEGEVAAILDLGVELRLGQRLGTDISLSSLRDDGFDAVFVAVGAMRSRDLRIPGSELDGVLAAVDFLLNVNQGYRVDLGERVVVVGGGNVALDAARTALREVALGRTAPAAIRVAEDGVNAAAMATMDAARAAVRLGAREVLVVALESPEEIPADRFEIDEAEMEGIRILYRRGPKRILGEGRVEALETLDVASVFDADGRFDPHFTEGTEHLVGADSVILAIGQSPDLSWLDPADGVEVSPRGTIVVDSDTLATTAPGVYAGGDLAFGPRNLIDAIADGRRAAWSIHYQLAGKPPSRSTASPRTIPLRVTRPVDTWDSVPRVPVPSVPSGRRIGSLEVELGYTEPQARMEAVRCLQCFANIVLDPDLCILCGGCVDICPMASLRITPVEEIAGVGADGPASALIIAEDTCIRCGLCVQRCPTHALSLATWDESSTALSVPVQAGGG